MFIGVCLCVKRKGKAGRSALALREDGDPIPEPPSTRRYSGTLTLRVPPETHRSLAMDAAEAGVSMNRLAAERLATRR